MATNTTAMLTITIHTTTNMATPTVITTTTARARPTPMHPV